MNRFGYLIIVLSALCYGVMAIFVKYAYAQGATTYTLLILRLFFAAVLLWAYILLKNPQRAKVEMKDLVLLAVQGGIGFGLSSVGLYTAFNYIDAATASILLYTYPIIVSLGAVFLFKEKFNRRKLVSLVLAFLGCLLVLKLYKFGNTGFHPWGVLSALGAGIGYSIFSLIGQKTLEKYDSLTVTVYSISFSLLSILIINPPIFLFTGELTIPILVWALVIAVISTLLAMGLYLKGMVYTGASKAALISTVEPVFTALLAIIFLGEELELLQALGGVLVLAGVINIQRKQFTVSGEGFLKNNSY
jgi:drug/metabolite transporter (DMT)-like permease